jgi:uncharacterized DUF497 family protein
MADSSTAMPNRALQPTAAVAAAAELRRWALTDMRLWFYAFNMYTKRMEVEFDPAKAAANLKKHRVSFAHAEQALRDLSAITIEDPDATDEQRFITLGINALGRVLTVVHTQRGEWTRLISARKASPNEARQYHA